MKLDEAIHSIRTCAMKMEATYQKPVFDEWAIVSLLPGQERVLTYIGPRVENFQKQFTIDVSSLREELAKERHGVGDFEFARDAKGTHFDAFVVVSDGVYLICNNTALTVENITRDKLWLQAQVAFAELSDRFRSDPLVVAEKP